MLAARTIARPARRLCAAPQCVSLARSLSTTPAIKAQHVSSSSDAASGPAAPKKRKPLTQEQRDFLSSALRVNQSGELAAVLIYTAQGPPSSASTPISAP
uniref:Uncharacterized protein n=1 Tax=Bionectria ochroleuca TaxID=29856 RepID=A0A8H7K837_BIOOC